MMRKFYDTSTDDNRLCEICWANKLPYDPQEVTMDSWWYEINTHCIELRKNRVARENKNTQLKKTYF